MWETSRRYATLSVNSACMEFGMNDCMVRLTPRHGYTPKMLSTLFRAQVITLQEFNSPNPAVEEESCQCLLCPVHMLRAFVDRTGSFCLLEQLFICYGAAKKCYPVSKQRLSHWIVEAICLAYTSQEADCPIGVHIHSTRSLASSWAWSKGMSIQDICLEAG